MSESLEIIKIKKRRATRERLKKLFENSNLVFVIHYSCESFTDITEGRTPRITSIAIRNLDSARTDSFSIHKVAEKNHIDISSIPLQYDSLEKEMLDEYFKFIESKTEYQYIHWNMRDVNYGFIAIEHRYRVLGGNPISIDESKKFDLARALVTLYGRKYIPHGENGRLHSLIEKNKITNISLLTGSEEAEAFKKAEYVKLHQSTLRKVDILANIFERTIDGTLKTDAKWWDKHGINPIVLIELAKDHWFVTLIIIIVPFLIYMFDVVKFFEAAWEMIKNHPIK